MAEESVVMWRCAWREGGNEIQRDFDTEDAATRHQTWLGRATPFRVAIVAHVYAIRVWPHDSVTGSDNEGDAA